MKLWMKREGIIASGSPQHPQSDIPPYIKRLFRLKKVRKGEAPEQTIKKTEGSKKGAAGNFLESELPLF